MTAERTTASELARVRERHSGIETDATEDAPMLCRFLGDNETCRAGLDIAEHNLTAQGWEHPRGLDARGYWTFDAEVVR